jgi:hypothetical protein
MVCASCAISRLRRGKCQRAIGVPVQRRAGHDDISTTLGYVKAAEDLGGSAGAPFPPLRAPLLDHSFAFQPEKCPEIVPKEGVEQPRKHGIGGFCRGFGVS